jgi:hypothetical protein
MPFFLFLGVLILKRRKKSMMHEEERRRGADKPMKEKIKKNNERLGELHRHMRRGREDFYLEPNPHEQFPIEDYSAPSV